MAVAKEGWRSGQWNAYVVMGETKEERKARLEECPEEYRDGVRRHVQTSFAIRQAIKKPR
jgi:hypothetical protein